MCADILTVTVHVVTAAALHGSRVAGRGRAGQLTAAHPSYIMSHLPSGRPPAGARMDGEEKARPRHQTGDWTPETEIIKHQYFTILSRSHVQYVHAMNLIICVCTLSHLPLSDQSLAVIV